MHLPPLSHLTQVCFDWLTRSSCLEGARDGLGLGMGGLLRGGANP